MVCRQHVEHPYGYSGTFLVTTAWFVAEIGPSPSLFMHVQYAAVKNFAWVSAYLVVSGGMVIFLWISKLTDINSNRSIW
jgi:hypothetical protein